MTAQLTIDSHVHLIPLSAANNASHAWLHDGHPLQRQWSISDYLTTSSQLDHVDLKGFIYVETDRALGPAHLDPQERWQGPLEELAFVRSLVEGTMQGGTNDINPQGRFLLGSVLWAPVDQGPQVLEEYLDLAQRAAGPATWQRVKGFRYLVQGIRNQEEFTNLVLGDGFVDSLKLLVMKGFVFDVGLDQRQGGVWQLEAFLECIKRVRSGCSPSEYGTFVLNHLCKPDMKNLPKSPHQKEQFARWRDCMMQFSGLDGVYMKLSGGFSELPQQEDAEPWTSEQIVNSMQPWMQCAYDSFGSAKIMFGSDWPVCTVSGPGAELSWASWHSAVAMFIERQNMNQTSKDDIWFKAATKAYRLNVPG